MLQWLNAPTSMLRSTTTAVLVALGLIALWTGLWALATKLNHGSWHVRVHLTIASIGAAFCAWGYWVAGLVAFAAQWSSLLPTGVAVLPRGRWLHCTCICAKATHYGRRIALAARRRDCRDRSVAWIVTIGVDDGDVSRVDLGRTCNSGERVSAEPGSAGPWPGVDKLRTGGRPGRQMSLLNAPLRRRPKQSATTTPP
jgi:hypothetical protein